MWRKRSLSIAAVVLCAQVLTSGTLAKTIYVDDDAPRGDGTSWARAYRLLQDGLAHATDGDQVRVGQGLYKPDRSILNPGRTGDRSVSFEVAAGVHLRGGFAGLGADDPNAWDPTAYPCVLSGDLNGDDEPVADPCDLMDAPSRLDNACHVVLLTGGVLEGFEITAGYGYRYGNARPFDRTSTTDHAGGGIWGEGTIRDCFIYDNYALDGGGGVCCAGKYNQPEDERPTISVQQCRFLGNGTRHYGGGICLTYCQGDLNGCEIQGNWARRYGGGGDFYCSDTRVVNCQFVGNEAGIFGSGGGVSCRREGILDYGSTEFARCCFALNKAHYTGGGCCFLYSDCLFTACEIKQNSSDSPGGGWAAYVSSLILKNTLVHGNRTSTYGGAGQIRQYSSLECENCTIVNNSAAEGSFLAVGINSSKNTLETVCLSNCIIRNDGQELWSYDGDIQIDHTNLVIQRDLWYHRYNGIVLGEGNIETDPRFVNSGYWEDSDTPNDPNDDVYVAGDYHLKSQAGHWDSASGSWVQDDVTSPCVDAGDANTAIMYEPFPNGGIVNMGAYGGTAEASKSYFGEPVCETIITGDINGDGSVDINDLILLIDHWTDP